MSIWNRNSFIIVLLPYLLVPLTSVSNYLLFNLCKSILDFMQISFIVQAIRYIGLISIEYESFRMAENPSEMSAWWHFEVIFIK